LSILTLKMLCCGFFISGLTTAIWTVLGKYPNDRDLIILRKAFKTSETH